MKLPHTLFKAITCIVLTTFTGSLFFPVPAYAQVHFTISRSIDDRVFPGALPLNLKGLQVHPDDPGQLDFILDTHNNLTKNAVKEEAGRFFKYFLTALTIPQDDIWVNLSPYEHQRMIPVEFSYTEMGRDFLIEDYALKQLAASLIYPETKLGREFWNRVYQKTYRLYGTTNVPINTFNKVWIVPDRPAVYVHGHEVFIIRNHLKVLSEKDFLASSKYFSGKRGEAGKGAATGKAVNTLSADIVKEIIIPEIERQVNESPDFMKLRQIYQAMILATWFKKNLRDNILSKIYLDQNKISGVDVKDRQVKEKIYQQYLKIFKKGVFNFIQEDYDSYSKQVVPRKYFSGGLQGVKNVLEKKTLDDLNLPEKKELPSSRAMIVTADLFGIVHKAIAAINRIKPYGQNLLQNVSRDCFMELDPAYDIYKILDERSKGKQKLLLIGGDRANSPIELALRYPNIEIWSVNNKTDQGNDEIIWQIMQGKGFTLPQINKARSRIKFLNFDPLDRTQRDRVLGDQKFDMVFFEPHTQNYFKDKIGPIEEFFNRFVKVGGEYGFVSNSIFTSQQAFLESDFGSPFYERNPDPLAVHLIQKAFSSRAELRYVKKLGGNLYLRYRRTSAGDVHIPLTMVKNKKFRASLSSPLVWSIYRPQEQVPQPATQNEVAISNSSFTYSSLSEFFDSLVLSAHPFSTNPIIVLAGDPGAGKSTAAEQYRAHLESQGKSAVVINTDKLFNTRFLMLKQAFSIKWLNIPFISPSTRMKILYNLKVDAGRVNSLAQQIRGINASSGKKGVIHVAGLQDITIGPDTTIIIEGSLSNIMFGAQLPITKRVYFKVAHELQKQRIIKRAVEVRKYSSIRAKVAAMLLSAEANKKAFALGYENYDAVIETNEDGQSNILVRDFAMQSRDIEFKKFGRPAEYVRQNVSVSKYFISGGVYNGDYFTYASQAIAEALYKDGGDYFKSRDVVRVAIGYDKDSVSMENAFKMSRILAAYNIAVTLVDDATQPFMLRELTRTGQNEENMYDLAFHVGRDSRDFQIRVYERGVSAYEMFLTFLGESLHYGRIGHFTGYGEYKAVGRIPPQLFRRARIENELKKRLAVFDVKALEKEIPAFIEAMQKKGIDHLEAAAIEKSLSSYGFDNQNIGSLDLNFNLEGATAHGITDIDGSKMDSTDLAIIFIHYLHSIGQSGEIVKSQLVSSSIDRLGKRLGIKVKTVIMGEESLLHFPKALLEYISAGHMHFNYRGEYFASSPAAERLLALEIMLKTKMTLNEYLNSIYQQGKRTSNSKASLRTSTLIGGRMFQMAVPFSQLKRSLSHGVLNLARNIAANLGFIPDKDVFVHTTVENHSGFTIDLGFLNHDHVIIKGRYATSEADTLRLSVETPSYSDPQEVIEITQRLLFQLLGSRGFYVEEDSPFAFSEPESALAALVQLLNSSHLDRMTIIDFGKLDISQGGDGSQDQDPAMKAYGGISFQSQYMNLEVQGGTMSVDMGPHQQFRSNNFDGIIPVVTSVKSYSFNLNDPS